MSADDQKPPGPSVDLSALLEAEIERRVAARLGGQQTAAHPKMTVDEVIALHAEKRLIKQRPDAQRSMRSRFKAISRAFGNDDVLSLNHDRCDEYIAKRIEKDGVARTTAGQELQALGTAIRVAIRRGRLPYNPLTGYEYDLQTGSRDRAYTDEEIESLLDASLRCKNTLYIRAVVLVMRDTGIRPKELLSSAKANLNWATGSLLIPVGVAKSKRERWCVIWPEALSALQAISRSDSPWLFPSPRNPLKRISKAAINEQWRKIADVARLAPDDDGTPAELYSMRGTLATKRALEDNMSDERLMAAMGWTDRDQIKAYVRRRERQMLEEAARLQASDLQRRGAAKRPPATVTNIASARKKVGAVTKGEGTEE